jgi:hypothetical protein
MPEARRVAISKILNDATLKVGQDEIFKISAMRPPVFDGITTEEFYSKSVKTVQNLQKKYRVQIEESKNAK